MEPRRMRLNSLDTWRGLVIFLMMLDHVRDFFHRGALTSTPTEAGHTTVLLSMALNFGRPFFFVQVLYATGLSMIAMAALVWIGPRLVLVAGGAIVLLAPVAILPLLHAPGALALLRTFTVLPGPLPRGMGIVLYPFVPWLGVMCLGFGYGQVFRLPASVRARTIAWTGAGS